MSDLRTAIAGAILNSDYNRRHQRIESWGAFKYADAVIRDVLTPEFLADLVIAALQKAADDE